MKILGSVVIIALAAASCLAALAQPQGGWVGTWGAAPVGIVWQLKQPTSNATYRSIVHISLGGTSFRVELSNEFGTEPLLIGAAHIARSAGDGALVPGTDRVLTFGGSPQVHISQGAFVISDPVSLNAASSADLAVSVFVPDQQISISTCHPFGASKNYLTAGDTTGALTLNDPVPIGSWCFIKGVEVQRHDSAGTIVALGDSITDGAHSTIDANRRWPNALANRLLQRTGNITKYGVLDEGIGGNRLFDYIGPNPGYGVDAAARFDRDVTAQSGVKYLIILEGINDIGSAFGPKGTHPDVQQFTGDIIEVDKQLILRAHEHGIKVFGATITPYKGAGYYSDIGEGIRENVNTWIRTSGAFDGVIDFDKAVRDPQDPATFAAPYDSGDHLHPSDAGYQAMGNAIDLRLFK